MKLKIYRVFSVILLIAWMFLIFSLSSENATESRETSGSIVEWLLKMLYRDFEFLTENKQIEIYNISSFYVRKFAHFSLYTVLGIFSFLTFISYRKLRLSLRFFTSWILCILYAFSDEFHQIFVTERSGELRDVLIDSSGALFGILFCLLIVRLSVKLYSKVSYQGKNINPSLIINTEEVNAVPYNELMDRYNGLSEELERLQAENQRLLSELNGYKNCEITSNNSSEYTSNENNIVKFNDVKLDEDYEYGAKTIGKIVCMAAKYSNQLSSGGETKYKELINLILGHTEIEKAKILDIVLSSETVDVKKSMMDSCLTTSKEYFESVMAQKQ